MQGRLCFRRAHGRAHREEERSRHALGIEGRNARVAETDKDIDGSREKRRELEGRIGGRGCGRVRDRKTSADGHTKQDGREREPASNICRTHREIQTEWVAEMWMEEG